MASRLFRGLTLIMTIAMLALVSPTLRAQDDGGADGTAGGVEIDARGVLSSKTIFDDTRALDFEKARAAKATLNAEIQKPTDLRLISLNRLEAEIKKLIDAGQPIPDEMHYLAGLTRLTHVFYFPETKDIVIGGPAEGYFLGSQNRVIGTETGRAILQLQDLVVALRAFGPDGKRTSLISCSIDPTQEGLVRFNEAVNAIAPRFQARQISEMEVVNTFRQALGMQVITVKGISPKTRMSHVLVDADYHMKLIGIGVEQPPVKISSFISKAQPSSGNQGLIRWYFQPEYNCVRVNEDETAMQLDGSAVKLVGEDEKIAADGQRSGTGKANRASRTFTGSFTKMYDKLAEVAPLYAELRNVIDMTIAAAFIQEMDFYGQAGWDMSVLNDEEKFAVETFASPKFVQPVINSVWKRGQLMTPIGGGVNIQPRVALSSGQIKTDSEGTVQKAKDSVSLSELAEGQWWWN